MWFRGIMPRGWVKIIHKCGKLYCVLSTWKSCMLNFFQLLKTLVGKCFYKELILLRVQLWKNMFNNEQDLYRPLLWLLNIFDVFSWLYRVRKKFNSKFHIFKRFDSDWSPYQWEFFFFKKYKRKLKNCTCETIKLV